MRIILWHGWLLDGTGSNVYAGKVAELWRRQGHEVIAVCQDPTPERLGFVDAVATAGAHGIADSEETGAPAANGRVTVVRPDIGSLLPVFVLDKYPGFEVKRFVDLSGEELDRYLDLNVLALQGIAEDLPADAVFAGHVVPGPVVALRALGADAYVAKVHGSDLEYAVKLQDRYRDLGREGLEGASAVAGASKDVLARARQVASIPDERIKVIAPGVDVGRWRPRERSEALKDAAARLTGSPELQRGRSSGTDGRVSRALEERDPSALDELATGYDQGAPDPDSPDRLRELAGFEGPVVGYLGKLIPEKGVERVVEALALSPGARGLIVGFGTFREWLTALVLALDAGDVDAYGWLRDSSPMKLELDPGEVKAAAGLAGRIGFTGRLDHRYAPEAVAAMDILVVPSTLAEAFGMVAAEGAAAGALPVVARHSSLAEVAEALEGAIERPAALSFEPGDGATKRLAARLESLLQEEVGVLRGLEDAAREYVAREWTWERTAERLLAAAAT